jgi:hypothetical protein
VIGFGSHYVKLFPSSRVYDDDTLEKANQHVAAFQADLGGTQLLEPLLDVLSSPADPKYPRQVFVLVRLPSGLHDDGSLDSSDYSDESNPRRPTGRWPTRER